MKVRFDLQQIGVELEQTNKLLCIFQEFFCDESPKRTPNLKQMNYETAATIFVERMEEYESLIDAAQIRILKMIDDVNSEIERLYPKDNK